MSDLLSISSTAVMAYQRALGTVSNNIANVGTEGYSRQDVALTANTPSKQGNVYLGNGVRFAGVQRQVDDFVQSNLRNSQSELATQEPMVSYANRVIDIMGGESTGLTSALNQFFDASRDLSADPASGIQRANFLAKSDNVTSRFRELAGQLGNIDDETRQAIEVKVTELNTLVAQLALVNKQLAKAVSADKQPPELLDQRDRVLQQISALSRITTKFDAKGAVSGRNVFATVQRHDRRIHDGQRQQQHSDGIHKHPQHSVGQQNADQDQHRGHCQRGNPVGKSARQIGKTEEPNINQHTPDDGKNHHPCEAFPPSI